MTNAPWFELPAAKDCDWRPGSDIAVIGAGLAGLSTARALLMSGFNVTVYDSAEHCAAGASGSPAGIVKPYITRTPSDAMRFHSDAYDTLMQWLSELPHNGGYKPIGALQLVDNDYPTYNNGYDNGHDNAHDNTHYQQLNAAAASALSGVTLDSSSIHFKQAGWLPVNKLCESLLLDIESRGAAFVGQHKLNTLNWQ